MQSSGGTVGADRASARPVSLLMSGPVAGLIGGIWAGRMAGHENVITLDMGGTSADIGVAPGGELRMRHLVDTTVAGYQAMVPMVDVDTIGAGGGSIAFVDRGGDLPGRARSRPAPTRAGLLRARRRGADVDGRAAPARAPAATEGCSAGRCSSTVIWPSGDGGRSPIGSGSRQPRRRSASCRSRSSG